MPDDTETPLPTGTTSEQLRAYRGLLLAEGDRVNIDMALAEALLAQAVDLVHECTVRRESIKQLLGQIDEELGMAIAEDEPAW